MKSDDHLYLDVEGLRQRGWIESLVRRFLGAPDRWAFVDHWANTRGKRSYFLERVQLAEALPEFHDAFLRSINRRNLSTYKLENFLELRKTTENEVDRKS